MRVLALLLSTSLLGACAVQTPQPRSEPPPVVDRSTTVDEAPTVTARAPARTAPAETAPAVQGLLAEAMGAARDGDLRQALALLERAQRIEPRNPLVWNRLALVRLQEGDLAQAESLALRSNSYAAGQPDLQVRNWRIIADARRGRGDDAGARQAEGEARSLSADR